MNNKIGLVLLALWVGITAADARQDVKPAVDEVIIVFKTHFDIGYTDFAEAVVQQYGTTMMDNAFDIMERNTGRDPEHQFVWTVSSWPMAQMINQPTPEKRDRVARALIDGRFVMHALPFTLQTEASDPEALVRGLNLSTEISRQYGLPLPTDAKMSDVPTQSWMLPTLLMNAGVNFLHIGSNAAPRTPDVPPLFWWEGPDGSRLMTMYTKENYGTSLLPPPDWPFDTWLAIMQTGNNSGPPSPETVDRYREEIKERLPDADIRIGQMADFYEAIIASGAELPVVRGDMPDTWIQGFMSMPREVKDSRRLSKDLFAWESLNTLYDIWTPNGYPITEQLAEAYTNKLLFDEHTFGLAMPHGRNGTWAYGDDFKIQRAKGVYEDIEKSWREKADRVFSADKIVTPSLNRQLKEMANAINLEGKRFFVYNPLPWQRSGVITIKEPSAANRGAAVKDVATGKLIPFSNEDNILQFVAEDVPAMGYRNYVLVEDLPHNPNNALRADRSAGTIENAHIVIRLDTIHGRISSIVEKKSGREMVGQHSDFGFGQYIRERFSKEDAERYVASYVKSGGSDRLGRPNLTDEPYVASTGVPTGVVYSQNEVSVSATLRFAATSDLPHDYSIAITLYRDLPEVELIWHINSKPADPWPEAGWISLPFNVDQPQFRLARLGGVVDPVTDFVKGSNFDYSFLNTGMAVIDPNGTGFGISTPDAPGVSLERPGLWKYSGHFIPQKANVFVNLFNNLWSTNFTAWVEGSWSTKITLWFTDGYHAEKSLITPGEEARTPLFVTSANTDGGNLPITATGIQLSRKGTLVTAFGKSPDGDGKILRLWENAGVSGNITVSLPHGLNVGTAVPVDLRGVPNGPPIAIESGEFQCYLKANSPASFMLTD